MNRQYNKNYNRHSGQNRNPQRGGRQQSSGRYFNEPYYGGGQYNQYNEQYNRYHQYNQYNKHVQYNRYDDRNTSLYQNNVGSYNDHRSIPYNGSSHGTYINNNSSHYENPGQDPNKRHMNTNMDDANYRRQNTPHLEGKLVSKNPDKNNVSNTSTTATPHSFLPASKPPAELEQSVQVTKVKEKAAIEEIPFNVNNGGVNNEDTDRKNRMSEWNKTKSGISKPKKKSLMNFSKNTKSKKGKLLLKKPTTQSPIIGFGEDNADENQTEKLATAIRPVKTLDESLLRRTVSSDMVKENGESEEKMEEDENDDLDLFLLSLQNQETNKPKTLNIIDNDIEDPLDAAAYEGFSKTGEEAEKLLKMIHNKNRKDIPFHDFSTIPFIKSFYKECEFIKSLKDSDVRDLREHDSVHIKGNQNNMLRPILEWPQLGLPVSIFNVLQKLKFESPTPIQCEALPHIMSGHDFIGIAETGSGKTIAFLLPLFRQLLSNPAVNTSEKNYSGSSPRAIILTPTRELAIQIAKTAKPFADSLNLHICKCYGGQSISKQIADLKKHADIVIGTPGRIIDLLCTNNGRILKLNGVTYLVMDEADRMFDLGFEPQIIEILKVVRPDRQNVLFSATFPPKMQTLARKMLNKPIEVSIGVKNRVNDNIEQHFEIVDPEEKDGKFNRLLNILGNEYCEKKGKVLIFIEKQNDCDNMVKRLLKRGYAVMSLHGGKDQSERDGTIKDFKNGVIDIIVATSVASRGLDVENLNLVINYDAPSHIEDYIHRVGRTGRGGKTGSAFTILLANEEKSAFDLVKILKNGKTVDAIPLQLAEMANNFERKLQSGDVKFKSGFSGKGLEKLQIIREKNENQEKQVYLQQGAVDSAKSGANADEGDKEQNRKKLQEGFLKNYTVECAKDGTIFTKLNINDLPQRTRWHATSRENYSKVIELTGSAVTTRGQYFPQGEKPKGKEPLSVLIEGVSEAVVRKAVELFAEGVVRGLERETDMQN